MSLNNYTIWSQIHADSQTYCQFRKTINIEDMPSAANIHIFADNRYLLWVNGEYVERGPCRFDPKNPAYDTVDIKPFLHQGRNIIAVLVHYFALGSKFRDDQCARMMENGAALAADIEFIYPDKTLHTPTDASWRANQKTIHLDSPGTYSSVCDNIDARVADIDWMNTGYDDSRWQYAVKVDGSKWGKLIARPLPMLRSSTIRPAAIKQADDFKPFNSSLPMQISHGDSVLVDLGRATQSFCVMDFEAQDGSELDIHFAVRYFDTQNIPDGEKHCRYIARGGRQTYTSTDTFGCKYINITVKSGAVKLLDMYAVDRRFPFKRMGTFESNDPVLNKIWDISVNTVELCTEDGFTDCADRERAQWLGDGVMLEYPISQSILATELPDGTYNLNDQSLLMKMLRDVALSQLPDGRLQPMRPSMYPVTARHGVIEDFSCYWVHGIKDVYDHSGNMDFVFEMMPYLLKLMAHFKDSQTSRGLSNLEEFCIFSNPLAYTVCEGATVNAAIYGAFMDASYLCRCSGDIANARMFQSEAAMLKEAFNTHLWDGDNGGYHGSISNGVKTPLTGHAAMTALYYGLVTPDKYQSAFDLMLELLPRENLFTFGYMFFFKVLYDRNDAFYDKMVCDIIRDKWKGMIKNETATVSEGFGAGAALHNFGSVPAYYLSRYVLGIRVEGDYGSRRLVKQPRLCGLEYANGVVLTEFGPVSVLS